MEINFDEILLMEGGEEDKLSRWEKLLEKYEVIMWIGDQITDFPMIKKTKSDKRRCSIMPAVISKKYIADARSAITPKIAAVSAAIKIPAGADNQRLLIP